MLDFDVVVILRWDEITGDGFVAASAPGLDWTEQFNLASHASDKISGTSKADI
jgi:hypothetical protein